VFQCPHCLTTLDDSPQFAGQVFACPSCGGQMQLPPLPPPVQPTPCPPPFVAARQIGPPRQTSLAPVRRSRISFVVIGGLSVGVVCVAAVAITAAFWLTQSSELPPVSEDAAVKDLAARVLQNKFSDYVEVDPHFARAKCRPGDFHFYRLEYGPNWGAKYNPQARPLFDEHERPLYDRYGNRRYEGADYPVRNGIYARIWFKTVKGSDQWRIGVPLIKQEGSDKWIHNDRLSGGGVAYSRLDDPLVRAYPDPPAGRYWLNESLEKAR
jgi:hypothetical protein